MTLVGHGIYSIPEAARLLHAPRSNVRRWVEGYSVRLAEELSVNQTIDYRKKYPPVVRASLSVEGMSTNISFLDLVELLFVKGFRSAGVALPKIRAAAEYMARELGVSDHPFARQQFKTDGAEIFWQFEGETDNHQELVVISKQGQKALPEVVEVYLDEIEFEGLEGLARRWWPLGKWQPVVIDPSISFGQPIIARSGIPTSVIEEHASGGDSEPEIAEWFGISEEEVSAALSFESQLLATA